MGHTILMTTLLSATLLAVACTSKDENQSTAGVKLENAKAETKAAVRSMRDYAYAERSEFVDKMKKDMVGTQEELDRLGAKVDSANDAAKADAKVKLAAVREKWSQAKKQLERAESATASDWDDVKNGFKQSYIDLKITFNQTRQWLSDRIAP